VAISSCFEEALGFDSGDSNFYRYMRNSPTNGNDLTGLAGAGPTITAPERKLSNKEKSNLVEKSLAEMKEALRRVEELRRQAREQKDVVTLNCLNERATEVKRLLELAKQAARKVEDANASGDEAAADEQLRSIQDLRQKIAHSLKEAEECLAGPVFCPENTVTPVEEKPPPSEESSYPRE
jgi:hypothetical protein